MQSVNKHQGLVVAILTGVAGFLVLCSLTTLVVSFRALLAGTPLAASSIWIVANLLLVPVVLASSTYFFYRKFRSGETSREPNRLVPEANISSDRVQETNLQNYLDYMSKLLLEKNLRRAGQDSEVRSLARARTMTTLRGLNHDRQASVINFLHESRLINIDDTVISLAGATLDYVSLAQANLKKINLFSVL